MASRTPTRRTPAPKKKPAAEPQKRGRGRPPKEPGTARKWSLEVKVSERDLGRIDAVRGETSRSTYAYETLMARVANDETA
jgi:hypothetical protein